MKTKHCPQCDRDLPKLHFAACHSRPDGLARTCRHCDSDRRSKYRHEDSYRRACKRWRLGHFAEATNIAPVFGAGSKLAASASAATAVIPTDRIPSAPDNGGQ